jgi:CDP-diacylglycerol pyrophosphatase
MINKTIPSAILLAVAAMHDRAARRNRRDSVRRLVHEECAMHLRAISDDHNAIDALIAGIDKTELTAGDI